MEQLKNLYNSTDSLKIVLHELNNAEVNERLLKGKSLFNDLAKLIQQDTITEKEAITIEAFTENSENLYSLKMNYKNLFEQIRAEEKALINLQNDISKGFGKRQKYNSYINFEKIKVDKLKELTSTYKQNLGDVLLQNKEKFDLLNQIYLSKINKN